MNYKVGDEVMCIDARPITPNGRTGLELGKHYVVLGVAHGHCGQELLDVGVMATLRHRCCQCMQSIAGSRPGHMPWRFIKLPEVTARSEVTSEAEAI